MKIILLLLSLFTLLFSFGCAHVRQGYYVRPVYPSAYPVIAVHHSHYGSGYGYSHHTYGYGASPIVVAHVHVHHHYR